MAAPTTIEQLLLLTLFVIPGVTYQFVRERSRGLVPGERDIGERVLRAFFTSVITISVYGLVAGPWLLEFVTPVNGTWFGGATARPRQAALLVIGLLVLVPALLAWAMGRWSYRARANGKRIYPGQSAWDRLLNCPRPRLVRARLKSGDWVGGRYDLESFGSGDPKDPELYLSIEYQMDARGNFGTPMTRSAGIYIHLRDVDIVEFIEPRPKPALLKGATA